MLFPRLNPHPRPLFSIIALASLEESEPDLGHKPPFFISKPVNDVESTIAGTLLDVIDRTDTHLAVNTRDCLSVSVVI